MASPPVIDLAEMLTSLLPPGLDKAMFFSTGSESNEAAIRLAKMHTGKFEIVALAQSWHGMTCQTQAAQYFDGRKGCGTYLRSSKTLTSTKKFCAGPNFPGSFMLPQPNAYRSIFRHPDGSYDWETELNYGWEMIDQASCGCLAACIVECIQGDAGIHPLPHGYLKALKRHCELRGMLLIVDEAQTGLGRTGELFGIDTEACDGVVPDIMTLSKPVGGGMPLSAVVTSVEIDEDCKEKGFLFFTSHTNDPLVAAVGLKTVEIVVRYDWAENARKMGKHLLEGLRRLQRRFECIGDVRGHGLLVGLEIVKDRGGKVPDLEYASCLAQAMWRRGLWCQLQSKAVFRIGPPINCTSAEIEEGLRVLEEVFEEVASVNGFHT